MSDPGYTLSFWVKFDNTNSTSKTILTSIGSAGQLTYDGKKPVGVDSQSGNIGFNSMSIPNTIYAGLTVYQSNGNLNIALRSSAGANNYSVSSAFETDRWYHVWISIDGLVQNTPIVCLNGDSKTVDPDSGNSATGDVFALYTLQVGGSTDAEMQGSITELGIFNGRYTGTTYASAIYNNGRRSQHILDNIPDLADKLNNYWNIGDEFTGVSLPSLPYTDSDENDLDGQTAYILGDFHARNNDYLYIPTGSELFITDGVLRDNKNSSILVPGDYYDTIDDAITADSSISSVTYTADSTNYSASFVITHATAGSSVNGNTLSETGTTFDNLSAFADGSNASGMASTADAFLYIRKFNTSNAYKSAGTLDDTDYVRIDFQTNNTTTATNSSYTTNPVEINVADFATDANLWDKVLEAINNHGNISGSVTRANDAFTLISTNTGDGNTYFVRESDTGNHISSISNTGGADAKGVTDGQRFELPYYISNTRTFSSETFEIDTTTGTTNNLTNASHIPLPALSSSAQDWQKTYTITNNTEFWNAITASIAAADSGKVGDNYDITYTVDEGGAEPVAKIVFTVKENAFAPDGTITSASWDSRAINTAGDPSPPDEDFSTYSAQCGSKERDYVRLYNGSATKQFEIDSGSSGDDGHTRRIDAYGVSSTTFWSNLSTAITNEMGSGFTVSYTTNDADDNCNDYADFTITKDSAGSFNFDIAKSGDSFANQTDTDGANEYGFGTTTGTGNRLQIGGTTVVEAHASSNSGYYVSRNQSQSNIISNIISSIENTSPGTNYSVTSHGTGNSREFRITASAGGEVNNRTLTGNGQFTSAGNIAGGTEDSGLGVTTAQLRLRKGNDFSSAWTSSDTAQSVLINIQDTTQTTSITSGYTTNPVYINVTDSGLSTDNALYEKIEDAIKLHGSLSMSASVQNTNQLSIQSYQVGGGNTNFYTHTGGSQISRTAAQGGATVSGSTEGHSITIDGNDFTLAASTDASAQEIDITDVSDSDVWNTIEAQINASSSFTVTSVSTNGNIATFELESDDTGSAENSLISSTDSSFNVTKDSEGGTNESGANESHYVEIYAIPGSNPDRYRIVPDKDNTNTNGQNYSASVAANGSTTIYVDSTRDSNADWWLAIHDALEAEGFDVSYTTTATQATYVVTNYVTGADGNGNFNPPYSGNGVTSGNTFSFVNIGWTPISAFSGGVDATGAEDGDTITIHGETITITHGTQNLSSRIVDASGSSLTNDQYWEALRTCINANVSDVIATTGSDNPRTFTVTTTATGSSANPNISAETGTTFTITNAGTNGTDEAGAEDGDTITIDGSTFSIDISSGLGTGSTTNFHNALSQSIKDNTDFDTITITDLSNGFHRFSLTSSVTGTAKNVAFTQNTNGGRTTFRTLAGAAGGTSPIGIEDLDHIKIRDEENSRDRFFAVDLNGDETNGSPTNYVYIDASGYTGTDAEKSEQFWNDLSQSIKDNTAYDTISIVSSSNTATFSITSSITGTIYNGDILQVYTASDDGNDGFSIASNTAGGTDETGASVGDTITIGSDTFTIVHNSSPTALQINASGVTDEQFFNAMSAAIKDQTDYDLVTWTSASNTASFALTSSTGDAGNNYAYSDPFTGESYATGSSFNVDITVSPSSNGTFQSPVGISGGTNGTFRDIKYQEIIPQPRYNYPHTLQSPGSMRCPTAKSNLGLIDVDYKLRSNHFALTRSLGYDTDGLYDNTSRWTTPDLSGLVPFDDDYNHYYERHRGQNKHFSLVPEFRISSHVKGIIDNGVDERSYFAKNWWLELTGTSFDNGSSMSKNYPKGSSESKEFLLEYSTTSRIRDIEKFIEENNTPETKLQPLKLTLTCEAINSFLPYEGFYPQTRTVQMCEAFAESYGKEIIAAEADPNDTTLEFPDNNVLAQTRPVFDAIMSPGLLYNTVKSGIAVDYPVVMSKMCTSSLKDPYGGVNHMIANEYFEDRLPFETLLSPESFMSKKMIVDMNPHPSSSLNLKAGIGNAADPNYKLMSNNFFAETLEFFMREGKTSRIVSAPESDPNFGVVSMLDNGKLPIYKAIFRVFKSKKRHPYIEFSGAADTISFSDNPDRAEDLYYNRPPSGTNYFLSEYAGLTGSALEYNTKEVDYPRPNMNPYAEVETITMYSQPNAFGPPCAGGVAVEFAGRTGSGNADVITGEHNNTTYMMYDSTNGYNAPFTPPYYDGEAWAVYTFTPQRKGKHSLDEILQNTSIKFLRYEVNHESGSFGDRGTFGPQGFTLNENAMQVDASFNLFKKAILEGAETTVGNQIMTTQPVGNDAFNAQVNTPIGSGGRSGASWVIESKFETPILDFSKYLNRDYNATMESDTTTADIHTASISLSGSREEPDTLSSIHSSLASVHKLSGTLNPIGMWHQYGDRPVDPNKGIFMQLVDMPAEYLRLGTEMTIPNPKWIVAKPNVVDCDGVSDALSTAYNEESRESMIPYVPKQENKRRMQGVDQFAVCGGALQIIDPATGLIIDTELDAEDLYASFGVAINDTSLATTGSAVVDNFKLFDVFRDQSVYSKIKLTTSASFTASSVNMMISRSGDDVSSDFTVSSSSPFKGHWAASYYHYDREDAYAPLLITTKNYEGLKYDYGDFSRGLFEDFLKDFSIGVPYEGQSARFGDGEDVRCTRYDGAGDGRSDITVFAPSRFVDALEAANDALTITNLAKVDMTEGSKTIVSGLLNRGITLGITEQTAEAKAVNTAKVSTKPVSTFKSLGVGRKKFRLIPSIAGLPASLASSDTSSYAYPEPMFVRGSIRYNAGAAVAGSAVIQRQIGYFNRMPQLAPQNDRNIATNPSTIRWGQFMHNNLEPRSVQSLARLVGFSNEPVKMGVVRKSRVLHEAVVAIPYILEASPTSQAVPKYLELDKMSVLAYMSAIGLITTEQALERSADIVTQNEESESTSGLQQFTSEAGIEGTAIAQANPDLNPLSIDPSIAKQIDKMGKYVFPPHLDFINYDVQPLPMYIFEFTKHLDSQDLSDIWQGVRSQNLKKVEMQTKTITHELSVESLLGSLKEENPDMTKLKDIRWRIFKVKQKGNTNYLDKMEKDLRKDGLSSTSGGNKDSTLNTKVGYNWPYDYFSLVENVKMKVNIDLGKVAEEPSEQGTGIGAIELGDPIQIVPNDSIQAGLGLIPGVLGVVEDEDEGDSTYAPTGLVTIDTTLLERVDDTPDESESIGTIYTKVLADFGTPTAGTGGGIDGDGQPDDPDIDQPDPLDEESDVQGAGGGSGFGGAGGGGVGQGNDGVDDDY